MKYHKSNHSEFICVQPHIPSSSMIAIVSDIGSNSMSRSLSYISNVSITASDSDSEMWSSIIIIVTVILVSSGDRVTEVLVRR